MNSVVLKLERETAWVLLRGLATLIASAASGTPVSLIDRDASRRLRWILDEVGTRISKGALYGGPPPRALPHSIEGITLQLDRESASDVREALIILGEHIA